MLTATCILLLMLLVEQQGVAASGPVRCSAWGDPHVTRFPMNETDFPKEEWCQYTGLLWLVKNKYVLSTILVGPLPYFILDFNFVWHDDSGMVICTMNGIDVTTRSLPNCGPDITLSMVDKTVTVTYKKVDFVAVITIDHTSPSTFSIWIWQDPCLAKLSDGICKTGCGANFSACMTTTTTTTTTSTTTTTRAPLQTTLSPNASNMQNQVKAAASEICAAYMQKATAVLNLKVDDKSNSHATELKNAETACTTDLKVTGDLHAVNSSVLGLALHALTANVSSPDNLHNAIATGLNKTLDLSSKINNDAAREVSQNILGSQIPVLTSSTAKPLIPSGSEIKGCTNDQYSISIFNSDDTSVAYVNKRLVSTVTFNQVSGWIDVSKDIIDGLNNFTFTTYNAPNIYTWGFEIKKNNEIIFSEKAGQVTSMGANNNDQSRPNQYVYNKTIFINTAGCPSKTAANLKGCTDDQYSVSVFNVDDTSNAYVNKRLVSTVTFSQVSGWIDVSKDITDGLNNFTFTTYNGPQAYTWGFEIKKNNDIVFSDKLGQQNVIGANNNDQSRPNQYVYNKTILIDTTNCPSKTKKNATVSYNWNPVGVTVAGQGGIGSAANQLKSPQSLTLDSSDSLYVSDFDNHRIQKYLPNASSGTTVAGQANGVLGSGLNYFNRPVNVKVDSSGTIYVVDTLNQRLVSWAPNATTGKLILGPSSVKEGIDKPFNPTAITFNPSGAYYVADANNNRIVKYEPGATTGTVVAGGNGGGLNTNQLFIPVDIHYEPSSKSLIIVNRGGNNVVRWVIGAPNWTLLAGSASGTAGASETLLNYPTSIAVDPNGNLFVADMGNNRIQFFPAGVSIGRTVAGVSVTGGSSATLLSYPYGVAIDSHDNIYVADSNNCRVQKFVRL